MLGWFVAGSDVEETREDVGGVNNVVAADERDGVDQQQHEQKGAHWGGAFSVGGKDTKAQKRRKNRDRCGLSFFLALSFSLSSGLEKVAVGGGIYGYGGGGGRRKEAEAEADRVKLAHSGD